MPFNLSYLIIPNMLKGNKDFNIKFIIPLNMNGIFGCTCSIGHMIIVGWMASEMAETPFSKIEILKTEKFSCNKGKCTN